MVEGEVAHALTSRTITLYTCSITFSSRLTWAHLCLSLSLQLKLHPAVELGERAHPKAEEDRDAELSASMPHAEGDAVGSGR